MDEIQLIKDQIYLLSFKYISLEMTSNILLGLLSL